jgi:hypothetical protein
MMKTLSIVTLTQIHPVPICLVEHKKINHWSKCLFQLAGQTESRLKGLTFSQHSVGCDMFLFLLGFSV